MLRINYIILYCLDYFPCYLGCINSHHAHANYELSEVGLCHTSSYRCRLTSRYPRLGELNLEFEVQFCINF